MTTMPPATSPSPFHSARPRRSSGPTCTVAMSRTRTGVPERPALTGTSRMSSTERMYPRPRTMNSVSASSMRRPPTSLLLRWMARFTCCSEIP